MRPEPIAAGIDAVRRDDSLVILLDPAGEVFGQPRAHDLAARSHLVLVCARYEGVDERVRSLVDLELSIGDYVLTGGELPALVVIDAVIRLLPGAIDDASTTEESFAEGLLEYPQYTRPATFHGMDVPAILTSGDHGAVARWRAEQARARTRDASPRPARGPRPEPVRRPPAARDGAPRAMTAAPRARSRAPKGSSSCERAHAVVMLYSAAGRSVRPDS